MFPSLKEKSATLVICAEQKPITIDKNKYSIIF